VPRVKYAMDYRPTDSFSMSYASRKVIFPGVRLENSSLDLLRHRSEYNNISSRLFSLSICSPFEHFLTSLYLLYFYFAYFF